MTARRERGREVENLFKEIMSEDFPNLGKETDIPIQESQRVPNKMNSKRPSHLIIKLSEVKDKEKRLKETRKTYI